MRTPNQVEAYKLAGGVGTQKSLEANSSKMISLDKVRAYLDKLGKKAEVRAEKKADDIIRELEKIGFSNIKNYLGLDNQITDISQLPDELTAAVESVQTTTTVTKDKKGNEYETKNVKLKLYDKKGALVDLGKRYLLFPNQTKTELEAGTNLADIMRKLIDARRRTNDGSRKG